MRFSRALQYPIREHFVFQRRSWLVERIAWLCLLIICCAALAGIFSDGILSGKTLWSPDLDLSVRYDRFQRRTAVTHFTFWLSEKPGDALLKLSADFARNYEFQIYPSPQRASAGEDGLELAFPSGGKPVVVEISARPQSFGWMPVNVASDRGRVGLSIMVYP